MESRRREPALNRRGRPSRRGPLGRSALGTVCVHHSERMRALRERQRRGLRKLAIDVSEDDLRGVAKRGYEGAATTDHDQQARAVALLLTDSLLQI
jgi:hypothetical protein